MEKVLVLQWPLSSIDDYDSLIELETWLIEHSLPESEVDGHDSGRDEMNLFISTKNPEKAFEMAIPALKNHDLWSDVRAAYREKNGSRYKVIWPKNLKTFNVT